MQICVWLLSKDISSIETSFSGIVIAGFGNTDIYPALVTYRIESIVLNQLRYLLRTPDCDRITAADDEGATVMAFAQKEMVIGFMEGIDPLFKKTIKTALGELFDLYPDEVIKRVPKLTSTQKVKLLADMKKIGKDLTDLFDQRASQYSTGYHSNPVITAVSVLPKHELASMAEALVNLTSLKRHFTIQEETVGGPIDVAVISKGDGFIWIKRKHYFKAENNLQFFRNKYR